MQRNMTLNILKGVGCFAVVMLHCSFPGIVGKVIYGLARFAVPLFFAVSGYFVYNKQSDKVIARLPRKINHIFSMLVVTEIIYFLYHFIQYSVDWGGFSGGIFWVSSWLTINNLIYFILLQKTFIGDVSWFLVALVLCYAITLPIAKKNLWKKSFWLIPTLLIINIVIGEIIPFTGFDTQWYWCSNFWLLGFPCFAIGYYIRINEERLKRFLTDKRIIIILIGSVVLNLIERILTSANQLFISNIPFMVCCFVYCLKYPKKISNTEVGRRLANLGESYSFGVYILHPIVRDILRAVANYFGFSQITIWNWLLPVAVFIVSIVLYWIWMEVVKKCKSRNI